MTCLDRRTMGELSAMLDTLKVAKEDLDRTAMPGKAMGLVLCVDGMLAVLASIVAGTTFTHSARVRDRVAYKGKPSA